MKIKMKSVMLSLTLSLMFNLVSCQQSDIQSEKSSVESQSSFLSSYSERNNSLKVSLSNASNSNKKRSLFSSVIVNIDYITINGRQDILLAKDVGPIDLMTLHDGLMLNIGEKDIPVGSKINQVRMVLKPEGNYAQYENGDICDLQIPSQVKSGLKIIAPRFSIEEGLAYSMVVDFNAEKSIVRKGNGQCLLKPVIKYAGISRVKKEKVKEDGSSNSSDEEEIIDKKEGMPEEEIISIDSNEIPQEEVIIYQDNIEMPQEEVIIYQDNIEMPQDEVINVEGQEMPQEEVIIYQDNIGMPQEEAIYVEGNEIPQEEVIAQEEVLIK